MPMSRGWAAAAVLATAVSGVAASLPWSPRAEAQLAPGWHTLVYTVNDSSSDLPLGTDIDEMVTASRSGATFTVYIDSSEATWSTSQAVQNTGDAIVVEIAGGTATVVQQLGEVDSGSPDTLAWFIADSLGRHPAQRIGLVIWDHGLGWRGIAFDEDVTNDGPTRNTTYIDAAELGHAMETGLAAAGRDKFDLLTLDACLMATYEIVSEVAGGARHLISSEELVPGLGLDYESFSVFASAPDADIVSTFGALADGFLADIREEAPSQADMTTLSLIDLGQAAALGGALTSFSTAAAADVGANPATYLAAAGAGWQYGTSGGFWPGFLDLGEFLHGLDGIGPQALAARDALLATLDAAVLAQVGSPTYAEATGMTVYFPIEPRDYHASYEQQPTSQAWRPFLSAFYDAQAQVVLDSDIGFTAESISVSRPTGAPEGWYLLDAPVTANFTGTVELLAARPDSAGTLTFFELDSGTVQGGRAAVTLLPTLTTISDGVNSAVPFTRYVTTASGSHGYSEFTLQRADGTIANLNWDRTVDAASGPFTILDPVGTVVGYAPQPGDMAYPIVMIQRPGAAPVREATTPALDLSRPWTVTDVPIPDGQPVYVQLRLTDAAGTVVDSLDGYLTVGQ